MHHSEADSDSRSNSLLINIFVGFNAISIFIDFLISNPS